MHLAATKLQSTQRGGQQQAAASRRSVRPPSSYYNDTSPLLPRDMNPLPPSAPRPCSLWEACMQGQAQEEHA